MSFYIWQTDSTTLTSSQKQALKYEHDGQWQEQSPRDIRNYLRENKPENLLSNEAFILKLIEPDAYDPSENIVALLSSEMRADPQFMKKAILINPLTFSYADIDLQNNADFILDCLNSEPDVNNKRSKIYHQLPDDAWKNRGIVLNYLEYFSLDYDKLDDSLKEDREILVRMVVKSSSQLKEVDKSFKYDKSFILECAVNSFCLKYAPEEFLNDRDFVEELLLISGGAYRYIDESLQQDPALALSAVKKDPYIYTELATKALRNEREIAMAAVKGYASNYFKLCPEYKSEKAFARAAVVSDSSIFKQLGDFRADQELVIAGMSQDRSIIFDAPSEIQEDIRFKVFYAELGIDPENASFKDYSQLNASSNDYSQLRSNSETDVASMMSFFNSDKGTSQNSTKEGGSSLRVSF